MQKRKTSPAVQNRATDKP